MTSIHNREIAARLAHIGDAMEALPLLILNIRERYNAARETYYLLQVHVHLDKVLYGGKIRPETDKLLDVLQTKLYHRVDAISGLVKLELAAGDYRVLMALLGGMIEEPTENNLIEGDTPTLVNVYPLEVKAS